MQGDDGIDNGAIAIYDDHEIVIGNENDNKVHAWKHFKVSTILNNMTEFSYGIITSQTFTNGIRLLNSSVNLLCSVISINLPKDHLQE